VRQLSLWIFLRKSEKILNFFNRCSHRFLVFYFLSNACAIFRSQNTHFSKRNFYRLLAAVSGKTSRGFPFTASQTFYLYADNRLLVYPLFFFKRALSVCLSFRRVIRLRTRKAMCSAFSLWKWFPHFDYYRYSPHYLRKRFSSGMPSVSTFTHSSIKSSTNPWSNCSR